MAYNPNNPNGQATSANSAPVVLASDELYLNPVATSASAMNADIFPSTDVSMYRSWNVQITGTFVGTYTFQGSNDNFASTNSTFTMQLLQANTNGGIVGQSSTTNIAWKGPLNFRYVRVRMTAYTSGTATATVNFSAAPLDSFYQFSSVSGTVTATPPNATATGSITASAQTVNLGTNLIGGGGYAPIQVFGTYAGVSFTLQASGNNGTNLYNIPIYDVNNNRWLPAGSTVTPGTNVINTYYVPVVPYANQVKLVSTAWASGTMSILYTASTNGVPGSTMAQLTDAAGNNRGANVTAENSLSVNPAPSATGTRLLSFTNNALIALTVVKATSAGLYRIMVQNPNTSGVWLQVFNAATTGAVTLGTTVPLYPVYIPASGYFEDFFQYSDAFTAGIVIAATTTPGGSTAVTTGLIVSLGYI